MAKDADHNLKEEQIAMLKNPPLGGPFHETTMSQKKLIDDGYLYLDTSHESYQVTGKGRDAINAYDTIRSIS